MKKTSPNTISTTTTTTTTSSTESDLNRIQRNSTHDDFFNRELPPLQNGNGSNDIVRIPSDNPMSHQVPTSTNNINSVTQTESNTNTISQISAPPNPPSRQPTNEELFQLYQQFRERRAILRRANPNNNNTILVNQEHIQEQPLGSLIDNNGRINYDVFFNIVENINQGIPLRVNARTEAIDIYQQIGRRLIELRNSTTDLILNAGIWIYNHPYISLGAISAIAGVGIWIYRGRSAYLIGRALTRQMTTTGGMISLFDNYNSNRSRDPDYMIRRHNNQRTLQGIQLIGITGGTLFIAFIGFRGLMTLVRP